MPFAQIFNVDQQKEERMRRRRACLLKERRKDAPAAPLGSWGDRSAPSARALSRVGELAGRRMTRQSCLLTDPQVRRLTSSAGCSEWERRLKPQLRTLVRVRVSVSNQPRRSRHPRRRHPRRRRRCLSPPSSLLTLIVAAVRSSLLPHRLHLGLRLASWSWTLRLAECPSTQQLAGRLWSWMGCRRANCG